MRWLLLLPILLFAGSPSTMLSDAEAIAQKYSLEINKISPPSLDPQPLSALNQASIWFSLDLANLNPPAFETLSKEKFWDNLREIGVRGVYLKDLKKGGEYRNGMGLDPRWGKGWDEVALILQKKGLCLIGEGLKLASGLTPDFALALKNVEGYRGLYHLIEIEERDWPILPSVSKGFANVPWLTLQKLHKKGYVPEQFAPYTKESRWNATSPIQGSDGKPHRWIYLKENQNDPVINWLHPSFAGYRIAASDILDSIYQLGEKIVLLDGSIEPSTLDTLSLWTRKLGGFSALETMGGIAEWKRAPSDLILDNLTRGALLHALLTEDAEALRLIYRLFLEEGIETKRLVHVLQPFDQFPCDYTAFFQESKRRFQYYEEILTGEALKNRLLKEDLSKLQGQDVKTWPSLCLVANPKRDEVMNVHLLLALFYAMQPGAFSFSVSDLLGLTQNSNLDLNSPNEFSLYGSLSSQMKNSCSFAKRLQNILETRIQSGIESAELLAVPPTKQKGLLVLVHRLRGSLMTHLLAINFGKEPARYVFESPSLRQTSAIDLLSGLNEKKPLDSPTFQLEVKPLSGKVILFQPKYYD